MGPRPGVTGLGVTDHRRRHPLATGRPGSLPLYVSLVGKDSTGREEPDGRRYRPGESQPSSTPLRP